jgi:hypothetical protein
MQDSSDGAPNQRRGCLLDSAARWPICVCTISAMERATGRLIKVFDFISDHELKVPGELQSVGELFPPVFAGIKGAVKANRWKKIGVLRSPSLSFRCSGARAPRSPARTTTGGCGIADRSGLLGSSLRSFEN